MAEYISHRQTRKNIKYYKSEGKDERQRKDKGNREDRMETKEEKGNQETERKSERRKGNRRRETETELKKGIEI